jgi:hypothetical protein
VGGLGETIKTRIITDALEGVGVLVCNQIMSKNTTVCPGVVKLMGDVIVPSLTNFILSPDYLCSKILESCLDVDFVELDAK